MRKTLIFIAGLLLLFSVNSIFAAATTGVSRKATPPVQINKAATTMHLSARKGRVYLDIKPAPAKLQFYTGKRRLGSLLGNKRTHFDVTTYANRAQKGQLHVIAYDNRGRKTAKTLNVSRYIAKQPVRTPSTLQRKMQSSKKPQQYELIRQSFNKDAIKDRGEVHSSDFDSSSKAIRQPSRRLKKSKDIKPPSKQLGIVPQNQSPELKQPGITRMKIKQDIRRLPPGAKKRKQPMEAAASRRSKTLKTNEVQRSVREMATNDDKYRGHIRYNNGPDIDSRAVDSAATLRATPGAALMMPHIDRARDAALDGNFRSGPRFILIEGKNFGNEAGGSIRMIRSNAARNPVMNYFLEAVSWLDTEIFARLPPSLTSELQQQYSPYNQDPTYGSHLSDLPGRFTVGLYNQIERRWLSNVVTIEEEPIHSLDFDGDGRDAERFGGDDCDDEDGRRYPGSTEVGDTEGHDEDCNPSTVGDDRDGDGYVNDQHWNNPVQFGLDPATYSFRGTDCNDRSAEINPSAPESCNYVDDNCDGQIDEGLAQMAYQDNDGDRFGDPDSSPQPLCTIGPSLAFNNRDCDDTRADVHPGQIEICNGRDDNCDGVIDEGVTWTLYRDRDGDLHGDPAAPVEFCPRGSPPPGLVMNSDDCDDTDAAVNPLAGTCP